MLNKYRVVLASLAVPGSDDACRQNTMPLCTSASMCPPPRDLEGPGTDNACDEHTAADCGTITLCHMPTLLRRPDDVAKRLAGANKAELQALHAELTVLLGAVTTKLVEHE